MRSSLISLALVILTILCAVPKDCKAQTALSFIETFPGASLTNAAFSPLPREWLPNVINAQQGYALITPPSGGVRYEFTGAPLQQKAFFVAAPASTGDFVRIRFPLSALKQTTKGWTFVARLGIAKQLNNVSDGITFSLVASGGGPIDSGESGTYQQSGVFGRFKVLKSVTIYPNQAPVDFWATLGLWPYKPGAILELQISKGGANQNNWNDILLIENPRVLSEEEKPALAFTYPNLVWLPRADRVENGKLIRGWESYLKLLKESGAAAVRLEMRSSDLSIAYADIAAKARELGISFYSSILQEPEDYDNPQTREYFSSSFATMCGYPYNYPLSKINVGRFGNRLRIYLQELQKRNLKPTSLEIGNEFDFVCFNTDAAVPARHASSLAAYAQMLKTSSLTLRSIPAFANTALFTAGMANANTIGLSGQHSIPKTLFLNSLQNVAGENYLQKYADGIGEHLYPPNPDQSIDFINKTLEVTRTLVPGKPLYISEFGFFQTNCLLKDSRLWTASCSVPAGSTYRSQAIFKVIDEVLSRPWLRVRLVTLFTLGLGEPENPHPLSFYNYRSAQFFPEISIFRAYAGVSGGKCEISLPRCPLHPEFSGTFEDNWLGSREIGARCFERAKEFSGWCAVPVGSDVLATYTFGGIRSRYGYRRYQ